MIGKTVRGSISRTISFYAKQTLRSIALCYREPDTRGNRLITTNMIKMILGQATCQVILLLILLFLGHKILCLDQADWGDSIVTGLACSALVFA